MRRAVPSTAAEGLAWKNVLEVLEHLRELKEQGEAGPLRDAAWADGMERGVEGIRDTIGRFVCSKRLRFCVRVRMNGDASQALRDDG